MFTIHKKTYPMMKKILFSDILDMRINSTQTQKKQKE